MTQMSLVSIVTLSHNQAHSLDKTISSALLPPCPSLEYSFARWRGVLRDTICQ
jgi:hypothetical protein